MSQPYPDWRDRHGGGSMTPGPAIHRFGWTSAQTIGGKWLGHNYLTGNGFRAGAGSGPKTRRSGRGARAIARWCPTGRAPAAAAIRHTAKNRPGMKGAEISSETSGRASNPCAVTVAPGNSFEPRSPRGLRSSATKRRPRPAPRPRSWSARDRADRSTPLRRAGSDPNYRAWPLLWPPATRPRSSHPG